MRLSTIKDQLHESFQNFPKFATRAIWKVSWDYLFINKGHNLYEGKSRAQSIFNKFKDNERLLCNGLANH